MNPAERRSSEIQTPDKAQPQAAAWPVVVIGGSAGALPALLKIVEGLPRDFPGVVLIALHLLRGYPSVLPGLLDRAGPLPCTFALGGETPLPGHIYVAPPDHHLMLGGVAGDVGRGGSVLRLTRGPRENQSRPSIDVLFRSAAHAHDGPVVGVLLSGLLNDGVSGLWTIRQLGGQAVAQLPDDAEYPSLPLSALQQVEVDDILRADAVAGWLTDWAQAGVRRLAPPARPSEDAKQTENLLNTARLQLELEIAAGANGLQLGLLEREPLTPLTCPECHGVLVRLQEGEMIRYRCHTGHAFTESHLLDGLRRCAEQALWSAARAFDEEVVLLGQLYQQAEAGRRHELAARYQQNHERSRHDSNLLRELMNRRPGGEGPGQIKN
ncbi:Two-component system, chemotaxis family, response regulator CheB [Deinococcus saxicola]|uniref:chemotaxis protein CheB n=1 Tax=Deinococcus saxicola TaxID=249406 RepID=UPI0039EE6A76